MLLIRGSLMRGFTVHIYILSNHKVYLSYLFDWITVDWMIRIDEHP